MKPSRALLVLAALCLVLACGITLRGYADHLHRPGAQTPGEVNRLVAGNSGGMLATALANIPESTPVLSLADRMDDRDWLTAYYLHPRPIHVRPRSWLRDPRLQELAEETGAGALLLDGRLLRLPDFRPFPAGGSPAPLVRRVAAMRVVLAWLLTVTAALGLGATLVRFLLPLSSPPASPAERPGLALVIGLMSLGAIQFAAAFIGLAATPAFTWGLTLGCIVLLAAGRRVFLPPARDEPEEENGDGFPVAGGRSWRLLLAGLVVVLVALPAWRAVSEPMLHWDERFQWAHKGKILLHEGSVLGSGFQAADRPHLHRRYPLALPGLEAHAARLAGGFDERVVKALFPTLFAGMLMVAHAAFRRRVAAGTALLFTALLAALPPLHLATRVQGGPVHTGFADLPLAALLTCGALLLPSGSRREGAAGALLGLVAGLLLITKPEGIVLGGALLLAHAWSCRQRPVAILSAAGAALLAGWPRFALSAAAPTHGTVGYTGDEAYLSRLALDALRQGLESNLLPAATALAVAPFALRWAMVGLLPVAGWALTLLHRRTGSHALLLLVLLPLAADLLAYTLTGSEIHWHLGVSLDRLWMQVMPVLLVIAAGQAGRLARAGPA